MSDYLDSLVSRALQLGPVVQPRLPSRFEPLSRAGEPVGALPLEIGSTPADSAFTESALDVSVRHLQTQSIQQPVNSAATGARISEQEINAGVENSSKQRGNPFIQPSPLVPSTPVTSHVLPQATFLEPDSQRTYGRAHEEVTPRSAEIVSTRSLAEPESFQPRVRKADNNETRLRIEAETRQVSPADQPEDLASVSWPPVNQFPLNAAVTVPINTTRRGSAQASEPTQGPDTVVVTIGRVDVRAVFTQPPAASRSNRPQQPGPMSLDEYLKQRNEGRR